VLLALLMSASGAGAAFAHAVLVETAPADGTRLASPPAELRLLFDEPVRLVSFRLIDATGRTLLDETGIRAVDRVIVAAAPQDLRPGVYVLSWRVVSADGHPIGGSLRFGVGSDAMSLAGDEAARDPREAGWRVAAAIVRFLLYTAIVAAAGGAAFLALVVPRERAHRAATRRYTLLAALAAAAASLIVIGSEGGLALLPPLSGILDPVTWRTGAAGPQGESSLVSLLGLGVLAATLRRADAAPSPSMLLAGAMLALAGLAVTGHAAAAPPAWLAASSVLLHASAAALWIGALVPLGEVLRRSPGADAAAIVRRYSLMAGIAVASLVVSGTIIAVLQVADPSALVATSYGVTLLAKLVCVALLLGTAALNRLVLAPALERRRTASAAAASLRVSIAVEVMLGLGILGFTAALSSVPPPRTLAPRSAGVVVVSAAPAGEALIRFGSLRAGVQDATITLRDPSGAPLDAREAVLELSLPSARIEPFRRKLTRLAPGEFAAGGLELLPAGTWRLRVEALVSDFERAAFTGEVTVR
jgi:copper transport protein